MRLSNNFELSEFTNSQTAVRKGISNEPTEVHLKNLQTLVTNLLQPLRYKLGKTIIVSSGYRSEALNKAVGGSNSSQHSEGKAVDFTVSGMSVWDVCKFIIDSDLEFDQLIYEGTWVHLSYNEGKNRKQVLTAHFGTKTTYTNGLTKTN